jgi:hypothetical protein
MRTRKHQGTAGNAANETLLRDTEQAAHSVAVTQTLNAFLMVEPLLYTDLKVHYSTRSICKSQNRA